MCYIAPCQCKLSLWAALDVGATQTLSVMPLRLQMSVSESVATFHVAIPNVATAIQSHGTEPLHFLLAYFLPCSPCFGNLPPPLCR